LIGMINDVAWFADGKRLGPGQSDGDIKVIRLEPPWNAIVAWKDVEFTVSLFARDAVVAPPPKSGPVEPTPEEKPADPPEQPAAEPPVPQAPPPVVPARSPAPSEGPP
jgi:hypothetical protein